MSVHVVYSCRCLNVKLHLANKYLRDNHEDVRAECFTRLDDPPLEGWQFELGMGGVQIMYPSLAKMHKAGSSNTWATITCLNCASGAVYSIERIPSPMKEMIQYPVDLQAVYRPGDKVIIHRNAIYGDEIRKVREAASYSDEFGIIIKSDIAPSQELSSEQEQEGASVPGELFSQHVRLQQMLEESIRQKQKETEDRLEQYRQEQRARLEREISEVKYDQQMLWRRMLEALRTVHEEEEREKRVSQKIQMHSNAHEEEGEEAVSDDKLLKPRPITIGSMSRGSVRFAEDSLKNASLLSRSLCSKPSSQSLKESSSMQATQAVDNVGEKPETRIDDHDDEEEDVFELDEEIESDGETYNNKTEDLPVGSIPKALWSRRRSSTKYIDDNIDTNDDKAVEEQNEKDQLSTSVSAYATSLPIAIGQSDRSTKQPIESSTGNAVNPADQDPTAIGSSLQRNTPSQDFRSAASTFDHFTQADQQVSLLFPNPDRRRKSIAALRTKTPTFSQGKLTAMSLDTRGRRLSLRNKTNASLETQMQDDDDDDEEEAIGPMIPPHILAASTYTDETEELFGEMPRSSGWRRTFE